MKKAAYLLRAILASAGLFAGSAASAASFLTVKTWAGIPDAPVYPTDASITAEMAYTDSTTPTNTQILSEDAASYGATIGGYTAQDFSGVLNVAAAGVYSFSLSADDAARLFIDGNAVAETSFNTAIGGLALPSQVQLNLAAGAHGYRSFTYQTFGSQFYTAAISGPGAVSFSVGSVTAAVPESASWTMMIVGFGMIGIGLRHRQQRVVLRYI